MSTQRPVTLPSGVVIYVQLTPENAKIYDDIQARDRAGQANVNDLELFNKIMQVYSPDAGGLEDVRILAERQITDPNLPKDQQVSPKDLEGSVYLPPDEFSKTGTFTFSKDDLDNRRYFANEVGGLQRNALTGELEPPPHNTYGIASIPNTIANHLSPIIENPLASTLGISTIGTGLALADRTAGRAKYGIPSPEGQTVKGFRGKEKAAPNLTRGTFGKIADNVDLDKNPLTVGDIVTSNSVDAKANLQKQLDSFPDNAKQALKVGSQSGLQVSVYPRTGANAVTAQTMVDSMTKQLPYDSYIKNKIFDYKKAAQAETERIKNQHSGSGKKLRQANPDRNALDSSPSNNVDVPRSNFKKVGGTALGLGFAGKFAHDYYKDTVNLAKREAILNMINQKRTANGQEPLSPEMFSELEEMVNSYKEGGGF